MKLYHFWDEKNQEEYMVFVDDPEAMTPEDWSNPGDKLVSEIDIPEGLIPTSFPTNMIFSRRMG